MHILPIDNITNNKTNKRFPNFKANNRANNSILLDEINIIREALGKEPLKPRQELDGSILFQTTEQYDKLAEKQFSRFPEDLEYYKKICKDLYNLDINAVLNQLEKSSSSVRNLVVKSPSFALNLADLPVSNNNEQVYKKLLRMLEDTPNVNLNVKDKSGITLLEKIIISENDTYLQTIKNILSKNTNQYFLIYDNTQRVAYDNVKNLKFKEQCKNLPIKFPNIEFAIISRRLKDLADSLPAITCGFCDKDLAFKNCLDKTVTMADEDYIHIIEDVLEKVFQKDFKLFKYKQIFHRINKK